MAFLPRIVVVASLCLLVVAMLGLTAGCHNAYMCPILQPMTAGNIPSPLPPQPNDASDQGQTDIKRSYVGAMPSGPWPQGDEYKVIGYRDGIRFYVVQYTDKLYRGGDIRSAEGAKALKALGIKTIISTDPDDQERGLAKEFGFKLVEIPLVFSNPSKEDFARFEAAVEAGPTPIYVHDFAGPLKAGILLAHYRIKKQGWSVDRAMNEYWRLDANSWDAAGLVNALKDSL